MTDKSESGNAGPRRSSRYPRLALRFVLPLLLVGATLLAYANAWPNTLTLDDKLFADYERFADWSALPRYFVDHVWAARSVESGLYRPVLFLSVSLDAKLFADWFAGYHLVNVLYHALVTLLVFGLISKVISIDDRVARPGLYVAFLAALIFGVHPMHTEVVNSIFNRSTMLAALGCLAGLWWLLSFLERRPVVAWSGLFLAYLFALFSRETAIILPGLAAILLLAYLPGSLSSRARKIWPVVVLAIPMFFYLVARDHALSGGEVRTALESSGEKGVLAQVDPGRLVEPEALLSAAGVWAQAIRVMVWPTTPRLYHDPLPRFWKWCGVVLHLGLLALAVLLYRRGNKALLAGLLFFYIALLPSSRLFGAGGFQPHLNERYLYIPSVGFAVILAYALNFLRQRFDPMLTAAPVVLAALLIAPVTWARNALWADELSLFEAEYANGARSSFVLRLLTAAHLRNGNFDRVIEICDANPEPRQNSGMFSTQCGSALSYVGRAEEAEAAYLVGTRKSTSRVLAFSNLAQHYMRQGLWNEAREQFEHAVEAEPDPARKAFRMGHMLVHLYPDDVEKLHEARTYFWQAHEQEPEWRDAKQWLDRLNAALGEASGPAVEQKG